LTARVIEAILAAMRSVIATVYYYRTARAGPI
jgi:hypothetical protein